MNLHDLETFVSVAQLGGVTRAAGQLHRSQPAITRRIKLLEEQLGVPLLERGRSGAMLTEAGRTFLPYAEAVLAALKDGTQAVQALEGNDHGSVSLALVGTLAGTTVVGQLRHFSAKHSNARLELRTANSFEVSDMVRRGEVSLGLRYFADPQAHFAELLTRNGKFALRVRALGVCRCQPLSYRMTLSVMVQRQRRVSHVHENVTHFLV